MIDFKSYNIFKKGSVTFFTASLFFPSKVRAEVFKLYAFVRVFDDFVDNIPQQEKEYFDLKAVYLKALNGTLAGNSVVDNFVALQKLRQFPQDQIDAFFSAMEEDLTGTSYESLADTERYMYGSAEVIGLLMARIMQLPAESYHYSQMLGKAFQYMNFLRDIDEDCLLGRTYIPRSVLQDFGFVALNKEVAHANPDNFKAMMRSEIKRYRTWMAEARAGFHYIPKRYRVAIEAASDMFDYTIDIIEQNPLAVFKNKIKPPRYKIIQRAVVHLIT